MIHDILVPQKIGTYYLFPKKVLSFNLSPMMVQGLLIEYTGNTITIKNHMTIFLKDFTPQAQTGAIKKIATSIGAYDEVITSLSSIALVFKELTLPFVGRDKLAMVVAYEVESLLPFSLDMASIDFLILSETIDAKTGAGSSTILVAAVKKEDIDAHYSLFEKAEVAVQVATIDMFALYELYHWGIFGAVMPPVSMSALFSKISLPSLGGSSSLLKLFRKKSSEPSTDLSVVTAQNQAPITAVRAPQRIEVLIDIGFDSMKALYLVDGVLKSVRMIPVGISDVAQAVSKHTGVSYYDTAHELAVGSQLTSVEASMVEQELKKLFEEISKTLIFFRQQQDVVPQRIIFSGLACGLSQFLMHAQTIFAGTIELVDMQAIIKKLGLQQKSDEKLSCNFLVSLALGLFVHYESSINFLKNFARKSSDSLLNKQLITLVLMTTLCLGGLFWTSFSTTKRLESGYNASKKQFIQTISDRMKINLKGEKNMKNVVQKAEDVYKKEKALWFSFSRQTQRSILEYLQDLSVHIDRESTGLDVRYMHLDFEKVNITGSVKNFEALEVFEEELMGLTFFSLVEKPRELSFTVQLKAKDDMQGAL